MKYMMIVASLLVAQAALAVPGTVESTSTPKAVSRQVVTSTVSTNTDIPAIQPINLISASMDRVVMIKVTGTIMDYETMTSTFTVPTPTGWIGSGAFISDDGMVLTCDHLFLEKMDNRAVTVKTSTDKEYAAVIVAESSTTDLALLKTFPVSRVPYFRIGKQPVRGQQVLAFGAPLQLEKTVSVGFVENPLSGDSPQRTIHSAAINPGNSGGPLVNMDGELVGVNVSHYMVNFLMRAEGLGNAVTVADIQKFLN
jgi:S1-C subfamily serine protease